MKIAIVGANGSIGGMIMQETLRRPDVTEVLAITRKPFLSASSPDPRLHNALIPDFGLLECVSEATWSQIQDVDALIWAIGTYTYDPDVNMNYPLSFQSVLVEKSKSCAREGKRQFRFILLGGAFTETDQSRALYFLPEQRRMKGLLQSKTLQFAEAAANDVGWVAHVIRPGAVLMGGDTYANKSAEYVLGTGLVIKGEELGAFVAELAVNGNERGVIENAEMVEEGRRLLACC